MKNYVLIVLYKETVTESISVTTILKSLLSLPSQQLKKYELIIWDNSPDKPNENLLEEGLGSLSVRYEWTPENMSLSKIYNKVAQGLDQESYLNLFDQDTIVPVDYFEKLIVPQSNLEPLILPRVTCQNKLVSPGRRFYCKGQLLPSIEKGSVVSKNLLAINSGMSIHATVFEKISYDERLRFYGTDTYFMKEYEKHFRFAYVLDVNLQHSLAEMESRSIEWHLENKKEKFRTFRIIFAETFRERLFVNVYVFLDKLKSKYSRGG